jgi:NAD(P)-dependent dehydrogenase (short-subunit alcohol dehydrogenase family)
LALRLTQPAHVCACVRVPAALSKLCNALYAQELNARNKDAGVEAYAVHPGRFVSTPLQEKANKGAHVMRDA